jgi:uncharacterized membrane protein
MLRQRIETSMPRPTTFAASMTLAALTLIALALAACGKDANPGAQPTIPDTASNFAQPFDARGSDPDWGLTIRNNQIRFTRPGQPDLAGAAPGVTVMDHSASWAVALSDRRTMTVSLYASTCTDAKSGATYAYAAEVVLPDAAPLNGCAGAPAKR